MVRPVVAVDRPLYHRVVRLDSLARSRATTAELEARYLEGYHLYCEYLDGALDHASLSVQLRPGMVTGARL